MLKRQRTLLRLLDRAGGAAPKSWLVRMTFLTSQDRAGWSSSPLYDFVPLGGGPFSFTLERGLEALERDGFVETAPDDRWMLTAAGRAESATIDPSHATALLGAWHKYGAADGAGLEGRIARDFPWFTADAKRPRAECAIYTVGYRGLSIEAFLDGLLRRGVARIVDVRANPASRRLGFHKSTLARLAGDVGVAYEHFPQLGVAKELRAEAASTDEWNRIFLEYAERIRGRTADLDAVLALLAERPSALLCAEPDAADCHRGRLAAALAGRTTLPVVHLDRDVFPARP